MHDVKIPVGLSGFADIRKDSRCLFQGLSVMEKEELCKNWMN